MVARNRTRVGLKQFSSNYRDRSRAHPAYNWGQWYDRIRNRTYDPFFEQNVDVVGRPTQDNNWFHDKFEGSPASLRGLVSYTSHVYDAPTREYDLENYHIGMIGYRDSWSRHLPTDMTTDPSDYINAAINRANPGGSETDITEFIAELRDLPSTFLPKRLTSVPIGILFGVLPLLSDVENLLNMTDMIDKRIDMLNSLTGKDKKERFGLGKSRAQSTLGGGTFFGSTFRQEKETTVQAWCVKTHTIASNPLKPPPVYGRAFARRLLYSQVPLVTAWNLMPWSWLIDYFVNVNAMLEAFGNRVPGYSISSLCICVETITSGLTKLVSQDQRYSGLSLNEGKWEHLTQRRLIVPDPTPTFPPFHPILSNGQIGNLGALALSIAGNKMSSR